MAQSVGPEFKSQHHKKKKKEEENWTISSFFFHTVRSINISKSKLKTTRDFVIHTFVCSYGMSTEG
jgi:hypothetical protein